MADAAKVLRGKIQRTVDFEPPWPKEEKKCACCGGDLGRKMYFPADGSGARCQDCGPKMSGLTDIGNQMMLTKERLRNKHHAQAERHEQYQRRAWRDERKYYRQTGHHSWDEPDFGIGAARGGY